MRESPTNDLSIFTTSTARVTDAMQGTRQVAPAGTLTEITCETRNRSALRMIWAARLSPSPFAAKLPVNPACGDLADRYPADIGSRARSVPGSATTKI